MNHGSEGREIDVVLKALGSIKPPSRLGHNVAAQLSQNADAEASPRWRRPWSSRWVPAILATACVSAVVSVSVRSIRKPHPSATVPSSEQPHMTQSASIDAPQRLDTSRNSLTVPRVNLVPVEHPSPRNVLHSIAATYPARPAALTEQERLLLEIAHRGDPVQLALLNSETQQAANAQEQQKFLSDANGENQ